jgi:hypothetical protein
MDGNIKAGNKPYNAELQLIEYSHPCALGNCSCVALPPASLQSWIPAIPAGMTCFEILVYNDERGAWECNQACYAIKIIEISQDRFYGFVLL